MAAKKENELERVQEDRLEDTAIQQFETLGYEGRLPDTLVTTYKEFKRRKDRIHPGPLSPEGVVTVLFLAGMLKEKKDG